MTGLVTAIALSKLDCDIDLITENTKKNIKTNRTLAISEDNLNFLNKLNISKSLKKEIWPCSEMKLYTEVKDRKFSEIFELNKNKQKKVLYMLRNSKMKELMIERIKQIKSISLRKKGRINEIYSSGLLKSIKLDNQEFKYNLIIICSGNNSKLGKNHFSRKMIESSYGEESIVTILKHDKIKNNVARQIFLDDSILALLPISNTETSVVYSLKKKVANKDYLLIKKKIKFYVKNFIKGVKFIKNIERKDLNFLIRNEYYKDRVLLFGDALHIIHPFVGQGFNMTLRDLSYLKKILGKKINLGLDIGSIDILSEFSSVIKPRNFLFSASMNFLKNSLSYKELRNNTFKILNKSNVAKNIFFNVADKGFKF